MQLNFVGNEDMIIMEEDFLAKKTLWTNFQKY